MNNAPTRTATPTTFTAATWAAANKVAEEITLDELHALLAEDDAPTIFPGKGKQRHLALGAVVLRGMDRVIVYDWCDRKGRLACGSVLVGGPGDWATVFDFYNLGRIVRVAPVAR